MHQLSLSSSSNSSSSLANESHSIQPLKAEHIAINTTTSLVAQLAFNKRKHAKEISILQYEWNQSKYNESSMLQFLKIIQKHL